jgi:outer membrane protein assembly factor BamB
MNRIAIIMVLAVGTQLPAADWPQWMGPNRNGVWDEPGVLTAFPKDGPKKLWSTPVNVGYSGPAVANGKVFVLDFIPSVPEPENNPSKRSHLAGKERIQCLDAKTGKLIWSQEYACDYAMSYPGGPRCTPTVASGKVYTLGAMGNLNCMNAETGKPIWSTDFKKDFRAETPMWGFCGHPLIHDNMLICVVGGKDHLAVAFEKDTGKVLWHSQCAKEPGYCPPTIIRNGTEDQLLIWHTTELLALNPTDGAKRWSAELKPGYGMSINAPQQEGDVLFAGGVGGQAVALKLNSGASEPGELWRGKRDSALYSSNSTPIIHEDTIYGCCSEKGLFRAVDLKTGERLWETDALTHGKHYGTAFVVRNGKHFYAFCDNGELVIADFSREKYTELAKAKLVEPTGEAMGRKVVWSHPAFADRCIFVRNDKEIACFSLAK